MAKGWLYLTGFFSVCAIFLTLMGSGADMALLVCAIVCAVAHTVHTELQDMKDALMRIVEDEE